MISQEEFREISDWFYTAIRDGMLEVESEYVNNFQKLIETIDPLLRENHSLRTLLQFPLNKSLEENK